MTDPRRLMARLYPPIKPIPIGMEKERYTGPSISLRKVLERAGKYRATHRDESGRVLIGELAGMQGFTRIEGVQRTRGGFNPDAITALDVAGALAFIRDDLAREIFCHLWWPEGAKRSRHGFEQYVHTVLLTEYSCRQKECEIAKLEQHLVATQAERWKGENDHAMRKAKRRTEKAKKNRWPGKLAEYPRVMDAVLDELAEPNHCAACMGRGTLLQGNLAKDCPVCRGYGTVPKSDRERAALLGKALKTYQDAWARVYEWLYRHCWRKEGYAAKVMRATLFDEDDDDGQKGTKADGLLPRQVSA